MIKKLLFKTQLLLTLAIILVINNVVGDSFSMQSRYKQIKPNNEDIIEYFTANKERLKYKESELIIKLETNNLKTTNDLEKKYNIKISKNNSMFYTLTFNSNQYSTEEILNLLNKDNNIAYAEPNYVLSSLSSPSSEPNYNNQWAYTNVNYGINVSSAWTETYGSSNVVVAVVDTGVNYNHPDLANNIWNNSGEIAGNGKDDDSNGYIDDYIGWDFGSNNNNPLDNDGHGTHVAGIIASDINGLGVVGVASDVKIMALKVADSNGDIYINSVINAIEYAEKKGVKIFNFSFGGNSYSSAFDEAIGSSNSLFITAAGNDSSNNDYTYFYPANFSHGNIISVASIASNGRLSSFSNYGATSVDIAAPGSSIYSTYNNDGYAYLDGTSMATPFVTGQAAILYSYNNNLTYQDVRNTILDTAKKVSYLNGKLVTNGIIDVSSSYTAIKSISNFDGGDGTEGNPYLISKKEQLNAVRLNLTASYKLTADIDLTYDTQNQLGLFYDGGRGWLPIGDTNKSTTSTFMGSEFTGNFDGDGHIINGLSIHRSDEYYVGLFAKVKGTSSKKVLIKNLKLTNVILNGFGYTGSISGYSDYLNTTNISTSGSISLASTNSVGYIGGQFGYLENSDVSYSKNSVSLSSYFPYAGGLAGKIIDSNITKSFNEGSINAIQYAGGIVGYAKGVISDVYNLGSIIDFTDYTHQRVGGIIGTLESGSLSNSYYIGQLKQSTLSQDNSKNYKLIVGEVLSGTVSSSYYYNPYNLVNNEYGTELTVEKLYTASNYIGFDFVNTWEIGTSSKLPTLKNMEFDVITDFNPWVSSIAFDLYSYNDTVFYIINTPQNIYRDAYIFSSADSKIVTVDIFGKITPIGVGETTISAFSIELGINKQVSVTVEILPSSINILDGDTLNLKLDGQENEKIKQLSYEVLPNGASGNITWSSSSSDVATVDSNGLVTSIKGGTTTIRVTLTKGSITLYDEILVNVIKQLVIGDINGDGSITITDLVKLRRSLAGLEELDINTKNAADINKDGMVTITDLVKLRRYLAGLEEI